MEYFAVLIQHLDVIGIGNGHVLLFRALILHGFLCFSFLGCRQVLKQSLRYTWNNRCCIGGDCNTYNSDPFLEGLAELWHGNTQIIDNYTFIISNHWIFIQKQGIYTNGFIYNVGSPYVYSSNVDVVPGLVCDISVFINIST